MSSRPLCHLSSVIRSHFSSCHLSDFHLPKRDTSLNVSAHCQLPSRVWASFHLDYPSSHERVALGQTRIPHLQPSAACPLLVPRADARAGSSGSFLPSLCPPSFHLSFRHLLMDWPCLVTTPGIEPHFCCCPCLMGLAGPSYSSSAFTSHPKPALCSKLSPEAQLQHH